MHQDGLRSLRRILVELYPTEQDIGRIISDAGIDPANVDFSSNSSNIWHSVLREARNSHKIDALINVVSEEYAANENLHRAISNYKQFANAPTKTPNFPSFLTTGIATGLAVAVLVIYYLYFLALPHCAEHKICIVTMPIGSNSRSALFNFFFYYDIQKTIKEALLHFDEQDKANIDVLFVRHNIAKDQVNDIALQTGASLFIWGETTDKEELSLYLYSDEQLNIDRPSYVRSFRIQPLLYNGLNLDQDCAVAVCINLSLKEAESSERQQLHQLYAAVYAAIGLAYYPIENFRAAELAFRYALYCMGEPIADNFRSSIESKLGDNCYKVRTATEPTAQSSPSDYSNQTFAYEAELKNLYKQCRSENTTTAEELQGKEPSTVNLLTLLYYLYGKSLIQQGNYGAGIEQLTIASKHKPDEPTTMIAIGEAYKRWINIGSRITAIAPIMEPLECARSLLTSFSKASATESNRHLIYYEQGVIEELIQNFSEAKEQFVDALNHIKQSNSTSNPYVILMALGRVNTNIAKADEQTIHIDMLREAADYFTQATKQHPNYEAYLELAKVYQSLGNDQIASGYLQQAQELTSFAEYRELANLEFCQNSSKGGNCACPFLPSQVHENIPNASWINDTFGDCFRKQQEWTVAAKYFTRSTELRAYDPWAHERLGYTLQQLGQYENALEHYQLALELVHPIYTPANQLERLYRQKKFILCQNHIVPSGQLWFTPICR